ncbi:hypothetical protein O2K51_06455 [Apibacter raozihei]|uniref:hypothetical protein n=1 Tax=Apibacter raozihei TaxID=2500547 RepID=UPI000FE2F601|nr:hypothetical protein [Apibacter raozihei]
MKTYIKNILSSTWYPDICKSELEYKQLVKLFHPDLNKDLDSQKIVTHLNMLKNFYEKGEEYNDESGKFNTNYRLHRWKGDIQLLKKSKSNYDKLIHIAKTNFDKDSFLHFMNYFPSNLEFEGSELQYISQYKCIPLSTVIKKIEANEKVKHINWIYSRMIESLVLLESLGITHAGFNPDSVFVVPEIHGIKITSFYHMCAGELSTISAKYKLFYPAQVFKTKIAGSYIDLSLIKKTAIVGLGDMSGSGVKLRSDSLINPTVLDYFLYPEANAFNSMKKWRKILDSNFSKEFVELKI